MDDLDWALHAIPKFVSSGCFLFNRDKLTEFPVVRLGQVLCPEGNVARLREYSLSAGSRRRIDWRNRRPASLAPQDEQRTIPNVFAAHWPGPNRLIGSNEFSRI